MHDAEKYQAEAREKWGHTPAYQEYAQKGHAAGQQKALLQEMDGLMGQFAGVMQQGEMPDSAAAQKLVQMLQNYITAHFYHCTDQILSGLGQMYVLDERFKSNIDRHQAGTAAFISEAIKVYCSK